MTYAMVKNSGIIRWVTGQTYVEQRHVEGTFGLIKELLNKF